MTAQITAMTFMETVDVLVVARADGRIESWAFDGSRTSRIVHETSGDPILDLASDGPLILGVTEQRLLVWNTEMQLQSEHTLAYPVHFIAVTPDHFWLAGDSHVARLERESDGVRWSPISAGETTDFDVHPSEARWVVVKDGTRVRVHDADTGEEMHVWAARKGTQHLSVRFTEKPEYLWKVANRDWDLERVTAKTGRPAKRNEQFVTKLQSAWAGPLAISSDRRRLAILQTGRDVMIWDLDIGRPEFYAEPVIDLSSEKVLASLSRVPRFAPMAPGFVKVTARRRQPSREAKVTALAISKDGAMVALGDREGAVHRCDVATGGLERLGAKAWTVPPRCTGRAWWRGGAEHGVRDGEHWTIRQGRLARLDFDHPGRTDGVELDGFPLNDDWGRMRHTPSLFFRGDLVWFADRVFIGAWEVSTGRRVWRSETREQMHLVGDAAYSIMNRVPGRLTLMRFDLNTRELDEFGEVATGLSETWWSLRAVGPHLIAVAGRNDSCYPIDLAEPALKRRLPGRIHHDPHDDHRIFYEVRDGYAVTDLRDPEAEPAVREFADPIRNMDPYIELSDGRVVGWNDRTKRVTIASRLTGELLEHYPGHGHPPHAFFVSADERKLLTVDVTDSVRTWRLDR
ncbi:WD40 repeat domain-containing protein [Actinomadura sp. HBU206391]|uniref:WD40 repeat domain-containing protein n=1 Tax=Actinomadura sp. HBU206391 TaxID=2731692 RepID=UPI00164EF905|nr:hypothetical protein [Actinomadura sp. HBU206391]MBC6457197.1 hypothetical protein [Actinomadura sp. HBU206391]